MKRENTQLIYTMQYTFQGINGRRGEAKLFMSLIDSLITALRPTQTFLTAMKMSSLFLTSCKIWVCARRSGPLSRKQYL
jgi:hypothetical protein